METIRAETELVLIRQIMEESRKIKVRNSMPFLVWGFLVAVGIAFSYANYFLKLGINEVYFWPAIMAAGWVYNIYFTRTIMKTSKVRTLSGKIIKNLWNAALISLTIVFFVPWVNHSFPFYIAVGVIAIILGNTFFIDGVICDDKLMKYSAAGWWLGSLAIFFSPPFYNGIIFAVSIILFQIVPGIILYKRWKKKLVDKTA